MAPPSYTRLAVAILLMASSALAAKDEALAYRNRFDIAAIDRALAEPVSEQGTVPFGDCLVRVEVLQEARGRLTGEIAEGAVTKPTSAFKWPGGIVPYRFDLTTNITAAKQTQFRDSIAEWAAFANLTFVEFTTPAPPNYITVRDDPSLTGGNSSSIGMAVGEQFIRIGPAAWNRGTICHEMGHALGYYHEQQRFDRDNYVTIFFGNIPASSQGNFAKIDPSSTYGEYDFLSVMHYSRHDLASPSTADSIQPLPTYMQFIDIMGQVFYRTLSKLDRAGMAAVYGPPPLAANAVVTNTRDSGAGSLRTALYYTFDQSIDTPGAVSPVTFQIPASDLGFSGGIFRIQPTYDLVSPGDGTVIDGATQTAFSGNTNANGPEIWLDGSALTTVGESAAGLRLIGANCTVKNLCLSNFTQDGVLVTGSAATGNVITGCYCGTDPAGMAAAPNAFSGVRITSGAHDNTVGGVAPAERNVLSGNTQHGVSINGSGTNGNIVQGNYIGVNAAGAAAVPNKFVGISVFSAARTNLIGGTASGAGNVISGNLRQGVAITGAGTDGNIVQGNIIGLNPAGTVKIGNGFEDIPGRVFSSGLRLSNGQNNLIGGTAPGARNVISGNATQGITITEAGTTGNIVQGNYIGLNAAGTAALGNGFADVSAGSFYSGISVFSTASGNTIGGTTPAARNVIGGNCAQGVSISGAGTSDNVVQGNYIGLNAAGNAAVPNGTGDLPTSRFFPGVQIFSSASNNTIGGAAPGAGNVISGNTGQGVALNLSVSNNSIIGNYIGTNAAGSAAIGNGFANVAGSLVYAGVSVFSAAVNNTISGNLISGNAAQGIAISQTGTTGNLIRGNHIGLNAAGTAALPNGYAGIAIYNLATNNTIGGTFAGAGNVISGNANQGIYITDSGTTDNRVQGNYIGVNPAGTAPIANAYSAITITNGAAANTIGGAVPGAGNVLSGNTLQGIFISGTGTNNNQVAGNIIGLDATGMARLANGASGVDLSLGAQGNIIGGIAPGSRNYLSGNTYNGVQIHETGTNSNVVQGNTIGLNRAGAAIGNGATYGGINIYNSAQGTLIGGTAIGAANLIAGNFTDGIFVQLSAAGNTISRNSITGNGGRGINLSSGNGNQAAPGLTSCVLGAAGNAGGTTIAGSLTSAANSVYTVEFFANPALDNSGFGEGQYYLGSSTVTTGGTGIGGFSVPLPAVVPAGYTIAATATSATGNTSGFSAARAVTAADSDSDGIPDAYENANGLNPGSAADANLDRDGDGQSNKAEFVAGTDLLQSTSTFRITGFDFTGGNLQITFPTVNGKMYRLETKPAIGSATPWSMYIDQVRGGGSPVQLAVPIDPATVPQSYFRVVVAP